MHINMEQDYMIAGFRLRVEGEPLVTAVAGIAGFRVFAVETAGEAHFRFVYAVDGVPDMERQLYHTELEQTRTRFGRYAGGYLFHGESGLLDVLAVLCFAGMFVGYIVYFGHVLGKRRNTFLGKKIREA